MAKLTRIAVRKPSPNGTKPRDDGDDPRRSEFAPLRMLAAELLLVTGLGASLDLFLRARRAQADDDESGAEQDGWGTLPEAAIWAPSLIAPLAAAAQLRQMQHPEEPRSTASRFLNTAVVGIGLAELAASLLSPRSRREPSVVPLALASVGLLGLALDREEEAMEAERRRLEHRASVVERLVPRRRAKLDRIVVHV